MTETTITQEQVTDFFKDDTRHGAITFKLKDGGIQFSKLVNDKDKQKYKFIIVLVNKQDTSGDELFQKSNNYSELISEAFRLLYKYKLLTKEPKVEGVTITSEITSFDVDSQQMTELFLIPDHSPTENLSSEDIHEIIENDNLLKLAVYEDTMILTMKQGTTYSRVYNKLTIVNLLVKYVRKLVALKKLSGTNINNKISIFYTTKAQDLNIVESNETSVDTKSKGFVDNSLTNSYFVLCSLSELSVDESKLKMWLNKILIASEKINKIYFN